MLNIRKSEKVKEFKSYRGVCPVQIVGFNPNKAELEALRGKPVDKVTPYVSTREFDNGVKVPRVTLAFHLKPTSPIIEHPFVVTRFFDILNMKRTNRDGTKTQVVNKYGDFAWLTDEEISSGQHNENSNIRFYKIEDIRPAYAGEEKVTKFLKAFFNVPTSYYNKKDADGNLIRVDIEDVSTAEFRLSKIASYFTGDFSEIKSNINKVKDNEMKVVLGEKVVDGRSYIDVFDGEFLKNQNTKYNYIASRIINTQENGSFPNTTFLEEDNSLIDVHEIVKGVVKPTNLASMVDLPALPGDDVESSEENWF